MGIRNKMFSVGRFKLACKGGLALICSGQSVAMAHIVFYVYITQIAWPCVPCINPCDRYQCDQSCSIDAIPITFTLTNITLPKLELLNMATNGTINTTVAPPEDEELLFPFFLTGETQTDDWDENVKEGDIFWGSQTNRKSQTQKTITYLQLFTKPENQNWLQLHNRQIIGRHISVVFKLCSKRKWSKF